MKHRKFVVSTLTVAALMLVMRPHLASAQAMADTSKMKASAMKGDAMKPDAMKKDAMKSDAMMAPAPDTTKMTKDEKKKYKRNEEG